MMRGPQNSQYHRRVNGAFQGNNLYENGGDSLNIIHNYEPSQSAFFFNKSTFEADRRDNFGTDSARMTPSDLLQTDKENSMVGSIKASTRVDNLQSENKVNQRDIFIEENDVSNQNTQRESAVKSKSSQVAQQIDDVYKEH